MCQVRRQRQGNSRSIQTKIFFQSLEGAGVSGQPINTPGHAPVYSGICIKNMHQTQGRPRLARATASLSRKYKAGICQQS